MNQNSLTRSTLFLSALTVVGASALQADTFGEIVTQGQAATAAAQASQARIDQADDATRTMLREFKAATRQADNLKVYNARLEQQIAQQDERLKSIDKSIADITGFQRDLLPLTARMIEALDRFVALDMPFHLDARRQRITTLRSLLDDPAVSTADKYRAAMDALRAEIDYGSTIDSWRDRIALGEAEHEVTVLRIGRMAMLARRVDGDAMMYWDRASSAWAVLDGDYSDSFEDGLRVANGKVPAELLRLPLPAAAEAAK
jgi:Protein of unknown function (DUF3450)